MDVIYIDVATIDVPDSFKRICVRDTISLKSLSDKISTTLQMEIYRLYINDKRLTDISQLNNYSVIYATSTRSSEQSLKDSNKDDCEDIHDEDTFSSGEHNIIKAVVLGEENAGKSSFIFRFVYNTYEGKPNITSIATEYCQSLESDGQSYNISILDASDEYFEEYSHCCLNDQNLYIIAIGIDQLFNWKGILHKYRAMLQNINPMLIVLMITKTDLFTGMSHVNKQEVIECIKDLQKFAEQNNMHIIKSSAKNNKKINNAFILAIKRLKSFRLRMSLLTDNINDDYCKTPFMFNVLNKFTKIFKAKLCG